ncbi:hypothetical protein DT075_01915 [Bacillus licheniformis]|nr:hypothetical protein DT075_01915 [Bacillus licheniformis]
MGFGHRVYMRKMDPRAALLKKALYSLSHKTGRQDLYEMCDAGEKLPPQETAVFDQTLMLYSEHEMPNSTFAARVIASTNTDIYGAFTGAVASLKGHLHGGANEAVMYMLLESLAGYDPELNDRSQAANRSKALRLIAQVPNITANSYRILHQKNVITPDKQLSFSQNFLYMLTEKEPLELAEQKTYLDLVYLLLQDKLPDPMELKGIESALKSAYELPGGIYTILKSLPNNTHPMDALRTGISSY